jgi:hypothetical protein
VSIEYDEAKVAKANQVAVKQPGVQFILYYQFGAEPPDVVHANVDLKESRFVMNGRFLMAPKTMRAVYPGAY